MRLALRRGLLPPDSPRLCFLLIMMIDAPFFPILVQSVPRQRLEPLFPDF